MAEQASPTKKAALVVEDLNVFYGEAHVLQGISFVIDHGVMSLVGRNGMGKSTLCNSITGLKQSRSGSIRVYGREISGLEPHRIHQFGVAYVPQGRRVWPSLTVDEHLRMSASKDMEASWTLDRAYQTFPRLYERRNNGGSQLSGGEQQMLAISRALLANPRLLVMDEPTEGLAPRIVEQVENILVTLAAEGEMSILVIEQNIGVATEISDTVAIMVNGRINRTMESSVLAADRDLQQRLLGVGRHEEETPVPEMSEQILAEDRLVEVYKVDRNGAGGNQPIAGANLRLADTLPNRWNLAPSSLRSELTAARTEGVKNEKVFDIPFAERIGKIAIVAGTFDTKARELTFIADCIKAVGIRVKTVDLSTSGQHSRCDVTPVQVAAMHPAGATGVFSDDRGKSVAAMADAFAKWMAQERNIGGVISAGGSGGTTIATAGMRVLPVGIPKIMVSTVAAGDTSPYVGSTDINMFHSVADVQGLNQITEAVLSNAAHALAGMIAKLPSGAETIARRNASKPAIGLTMFGVTTQCVQAVTKALEQDFDCLVFHATGIGGRAMETLGHSNMLAGFVDITTTEIADMIVGGVMPADEQRFGAAIETGLPWIGAPGALDMVNFGPRDSVPERFNNRKFVVHNPTVTLMRTTVEENRKFGEWIGRRMNLMEGPAVFLIPENGVSVLDKPGAPFHDPAANKALFDALEETIHQTARRRIVRVNANINDDAFTQAVISNFLSICKPLRRTG